MRFRGSLQDIRFFVAAYEEKSFTAAASRVNTTQPGISHHIRQLEDRLEVQLFVREKLGVTATPAADVLYARCVQTLRGLDDAVTEVSHFSKGLQGRITVGMPPSLTRRLAAPALLRFSALHPNVKVRILESQGRLPRMILSEQIDFAISAAGVPTPGVRERAILVTPECLLSRADNTGGPVGVCPLVAGSIKLISPTLQGARQAAIMACLDAHNVQLESELEIRSGFMGMDLVGRSDWRMVVPCLSLDPSLEEQPFVISPLREPDVDFTLVVLEPLATVLSPEAEAFVTVLTGLAEEMNDAWRARLSGLPSPGA